jgi:hypothetical protein
MNRVRQAKASGAFFEKKAPKKLLFNWRNAGGAPEARRHKNSFAALFFRKATAFS